MTYLYDIQTGEDFNLFLLIKSAEVKIARNGNPFIAFSFQDQSGSMDGMYWSATDEEVAKFQTGKVVFVRGMRDSYQGKSQVKIKQLRLAEEGEPNDPALYLERVEVKREDIKREIDEAIFLIREPNIVRIVHKILNTVEEDFYSYPAAKRFHHAMVGGLSFHTVSMLRIAKSLLKIYPDLNASLLIAGIILHDIGKTIELSGPVSTEYTLKGKMMGHIVIMSELIDQACREININPEMESIVLLKHVVLAHHGKLEFGSPVVPQIVEAELIHQIDLMDANLNMMLSETAKVEGGEFTEPIFALDRRQFYKPKFK
ncbi:3'-5' exoribonuclease YhaM family protein [Globicatella sanguinis]|uniref:3'-5' exoribonuclease YhaM family protein n=1 Tax=Globicatella sanguinis TaxID=13076 RepID=UPI0008249FAD|nr:HD domain-containing protein [Globicatella sanguinis]MDK7630551.1 HD domain-containing protein [Globicatella sanguinis]WIK66719.1 HD domain-containing protein [Globicatella sanguinis]WKT56124.1 HD domain-containing protein [Globicatella sanguinis]